MPSVNVYPCRMFVGMFAPRLSLLLLAGMPVLVGLVGCKKEAASSDVAVVPVASATAPASASPPAEPKTEAGQWYPAGTNQELKLTWTVHPVQDDSTDAGPKRDLELALRIGDAVKRVKLGPQFGALAPSEQSVCNASLKSATQVSVIHFHTMGPKTVSARRVQPGMLEISWNVEADDSPDKLHGTYATIPIPTDARIVDAIQDIRAAGKDEPFDCRKYRDAAPHPKTK